MNLLLLSRVADLNTAHLYQSKRYEKQKENCLTFFHPKERKKDRHKLNFKTRHWVRFLSQENYLLTSLEEIVKSYLSGGCRFSYIALRIDNKNLFFFKNRFAETYYLEKQKDYLFSHLIWREKEELDDLLVMIVKQKEKFKRKLKPKWKGN